MHRWFKRDWVRKLNMFEHTTAIELTQIAPGCTTHEEIKKRNQAFKKERRLGWNKFRCYIVPFAVRRSLYLICQCPVVAKHLKTFKSLSALLTSTQSINPIVRCVRAKICKVNERACRSAVPNDFFSSAYNRYTQC